MTKWKSKNHSKYLLQYHLIFVCKYRKKSLINNNIINDIKSLSVEICNKYNVQIRYMETDKNHNLAKSIADCSWYELTRQLEYKAKWNKRQYIKIDTYYASSQLCSKCGYKNPEIKNIAIRKWS